MKISNNNQIYYSSPRFKGSVNLQKLRQFVNVAEPEAINDVIKGDFNEYVKWWIQTSDDKLKQLFHYDNLNLYLMQKNIRVLLDKRGAFYYDISDLLTEDNYVDAFYAIRDPYMNLWRMRSKLREVNETISNNRNMHSKINDKSIIKQTEENQSANHDVNCDSEQYIAHKLKMFTKSFKRSKLSTSDIRDLAKILGTTEEKIKKMDKEEYRKLSLKFHPDLGGNENIFNIINILYHSKE